MKLASALCAAVIGTAFFSGGAAVADVRCLPGQATGYCAPLHFVDDDDDIRRRAYKRGYNDGLRRYGYGRGDAVPMPPDVALDGKEGYSQGAEFHRQYQDRDNDGEYERRGYYDDDLYDRRRSNDAIDFATEILRRSLRSN
jgi:hypothetical protein